MPDTEVIAQLKLKTKQRIKVIMEQAREREAAHLLLSQATPNRKGHYIRLAEDEIRLAKKLSDEMMFRVGRINNSKKDERKLRKLLGE